VEITAKSLREWLDREVEDGCPEDAPVIISLGNHTVQPATGFKRPNGLGYFIGGHGQKPAFYLAVDDPCFDPVEPFDLAKPRTREQDEERDRNWERLSDETFRLANAAVSRKGA